MVTFNEQYVTEGSSATRCHNLVSIPYSSWIRASLCGILVVVTVLRTVDDLVWC